MEDPTDSSIGQQAIVVRSAYKRYSSQVVLNGLNMTVPQGTIYGLLGPSGCGKTTLLNCIVGRSRLDSGNIYLKLRNRRELGYMPQDLALYVQFSVRETLTYYGTLYGMTPREIRDQIEHLLKVLNLPSPELSVNQLSGGQQRRTSLAVALIHNPQLLILDEPTVGVDPLLSHSIWQHLLHMSKSLKKTIVITTHYIEEARQAHTIGLIRFGQLLAEETPNKLMEQYNSDSLESVFLHLSKKQSNEETFHEYNKITYPKPVKKPNAPFSEKQNEITFQRLQAQFLRTYYWMSRNLPIMGFLLIFLPVVQSFLVCLTIGQDPEGLRLGIVNYEFDNGTQKCMYTPIGTCPTSMLSCRFINELESRGIEAVMFGDVEDAREATRRNHVWGYIQFSSNFSASLLERITENTFAADESLMASEVDILQDMSNQYIGNLLRRDMLYGTIEFMKQLFADCNWPVKAASIPVALQPAVYGDNRPSFAHFAIPAMIQLFEFYLPMMFTVGSVLMEKREGLLERSLVTGVTLLENLLVHIIVTYIVLLIQTIFMCIVLFGIFDNPLEGSWVLVAILLFLVGTSGMNYGFLVSVLCDSDMAATYMGIGSFFPLAMLSGMVWPYEGMHEVLRTVGWILPLTHSTTAFRSIAIRKWGLEHPQVYTGFISSAGWSIAFITGTLFIIKLQGGIRGNIKN